ncbi:MAG: amidohydrolase family protein [Oscillospiraceae bacterium]|nr:amidohydrolase family protein [Oscillospiraceae bacterium]
MEYVVGSAIYLDVSMARVYNSLAACKKAILNHDPDKILFGTDSPWASQAGAIQAIRDLDLGEDLTEKILGGNAMRLLNLS